MVRRGEAIPPEVSLSPAVSATAAAPHFRQRFLAQQPRLLPCLGRAARAAGPAHGSTSFASSSWHRCRFHQARGKIRRGEGGRG